MARADDDPRQRLIDTAADLLRRRGLQSTSIREVSKHARAPLGSTYHYFPGGKPQLISEAVTQTGERIGALLAQALAAGPVEGLEAFLARWRDILVANDFTVGCPVIAIAADDAAGEADALPLSAAADALNRWTRVIADALAGAGMAATDARATATFIIASVEGAILMCRATRSIAPFDDVADQLIRRVRDVLPG